MVFFYLGVFVPACFLPVFQRSAANVALSPYLVMVVVILVVLFIFALFDALPRVRLPRPIIPSHIYWLAILAVWASFHGLILLKFGGALSFSSQAAITDQRLAAGEVVAGSAAVGYAITLCLTAINPLLLAVGLVRGIPAFFILGIMGETVIFLANAARSAAGVILVVAVVVALSRRGRSVTITSLAKAFSVLIIAALLFHIVAPATARLTTEWALYRTFMTSSASVEHYFDYFENHPKTGMSRLTKLNELTGTRLFGSNNYPGQKIGNVVGEWRTGNPDVQENANFVADGFATAGWTGIAVVTLMTIAVFHILDSMTAGLNTRLVLAVIAAQSVNIANVPLSTMVFGGGFLLTAVLLWLLPPPNPKRAEHSQSGALLAST